MDKAGEIIASRDTELTDEVCGREFPIIDDWRAAHAYPLSVIHSTVSSIVDQVEADAISVYRLKRFVSIIKKLIWQPTRLTQVQDIGGCRVVVSTIDEVRRLRVEIAAGLPHDLADAADYIEHPRDSGYRGIHLIYRFRPTDAGSAPYKGLKVEVQLRTVVQHAWATAVETVDTFTRQALKSSRGDPDYAAFFRYASSAMARLEGTPQIAGAPHNAQELARLEKKLRIRASLLAYGKVIQVALKSTGKAEYYLLDLDPSVDPPQVTVTGYMKKQIEEANARYADAEKQIKQNEGDPRQVVLVSASSIDELKRAYPNYFLNTQFFNDVIGEMIGR